MGKDFLLHGRLQAEQRRVFFMFITPELNAKPCVEPWNKGQHLGTEMLTLRECVEGCRNIISSVCMLISDRIISVNFLSVRRKERRVKTTGGGFNL